MNDDINKTTSEYYQSEQVAARYNQAFTSGWSPKHLRLRYLARKERNIVEKFLTRIPCARVLDVPCGTGKLAPVFKSLGLKVTACDISPYMLDVAKQTFLDQQIENAEFLVGDAESITEQVGRNQFDVVVCLRLMHRVTTDKKIEILRCLSEIAPYVVVSISVDGPLDRLRRPFGRMIFGVNHPGSSAFLSDKQFRDLVTPYFNVASRGRVAGILSGEMVYLLKSGDEITSAG